jgi:hypothetical protein
MPTGNKKGKVWDVFKERLTQLKAAADKCAKGHKFEDQRTWYIPTDLSAEDLFKIANLHEPSFDREKINTNFVECVQDIDDLGTVGDIISLTTQCDYNAAEERAFRLRHASPVRLIGHSAARQNGRAVGPGLDRIEEDAANAIAAGAAR